MVHLDGSGNRSTRIYVLHQLLFAAASTAANAAGPVCRWRPTFTSLRHGDGGNFHLCRSRRTGGGSSSNSSSSSGFETDQHSRSDVCSYAGGDGLVGWAPAPSRRQRRLYWRRRLDHLNDVSGIDVNCYDAATGVNTVLADDGRRSQYRSAVIVDVTLFCAGIIHVIGQQRSWRYSRWGNNRVFIICFD